jgi:hypothetical protein
VVEAPLLVGFRASPVEIAVAAKDAVLTKSLRETDRSFFMSRIIEVETSPVPPTGLREIHNYLPGAARNRVERLHGTSRLVEGET